jgi:hypothetical protein
VYDTFAVIGHLLGRRLGIPYVNVCVGHAMTPGRAVAALERDPRVATSDACRRAVDMLVGQENRGWQLITMQLNHERVGLAAFSSYAHKLLEDVVGWARATLGDGGQPVAQQAWVQSCLGEAFARLEALKVLNWRMGFDLERGALDPALASAVKVHSSEALIEIYRLLLEVLGPPGMVKQESPGAQLRGDLEREWRHCQINTFGGGVNEVQREIIAMMGLGLPRAPR